MRHVVQAVFEITGRGTVVAVVGASNLPVATQLRATVTRPDGSQVSAPAFKEWLLLKSTPQVAEREAYFLKGVTKSEIPDGSTIEVSVL
jgi:hypothetical protein